MLLCIFLPIVNSYDYNIRYNEDDCELPSINLVWSSPIWVKCLLLSHFFSYGSHTLISIYATSWMTLSLFSGTPQGSKFIVHRRDFDLGISWGACDMVILSILSLIFSLVYSSTTTCEKFVWGLSNFLAGTGLLLSWYFDNDLYTFLLLPSCSLILTTSLLAPHRLSTDYDKKFTKICTAFEYSHIGKDCKGQPEMFHIPPHLITHWEKLMNWTSESSKLFALCIVPGICALSPLDDSRWAMKTSCIWCLTSFVFCLFL